MADEVLKVVYPQDFGRSHQLSLKKFFDPSNSVFRPIRGLEIQNGRQGAPKWPTGSGKGSNPRLLAISSHFRKISFLMRALLMRKGDDGEKILFRGVICCSGGLYAVQGGYMLFRWVIWMFRGVICCSGGLYAENNGENSGHYRRCQSTA